MDAATPARNLAEYVEASAQRCPGNAAIIDVDERVVSYSELDSCAERMAAFLSHRGVRPGDRVAVLLSKSVKSVIAAFGILKARATVVPFDWQAPAERLRAILGDCEIHTVIAESRLAPVLNVCAPDLETVILDGPAGDGPSTAVPWSDALDHCLPPVSRTGRNREDLAVIFCTSGSTGVPKAVMVSHGNLLTYAEWCSSVLLPTEEDRFSSHTPFHFAFSILDFYVPLKHGASLHLIDQETGRNPKRLAEFIARRRLTIWCSTQSILRLLSSSGNLPRFDYSSLRVVLFSGEVFPVPQLRELMKLWKTPLYYNLWGSTEAQGSVYAVIPSPIPEERTAPIPIGRPGWHCRVAVLDARGEPVSPGEHGMMHLSGDAVFQGYWNRPEQNRAAFVWRDGVRWYSTGDVVREDPEEGLIYVGRRDRLVKRHGYRIELDDIQCALYRHRDVQDAAVVAASSDGGDLKIAAYVTAKVGSLLSVLEMKMFCAQCLPAYMNPDVFVFAPVLPRTSTNKVDYQSLIQRLRETLTEKAAAT
jgi:amino acid adenylation domain-containing protein